ncbi:MAG TPA: hypothetical protein VFW96_22470 [Thermomicrobiales bacterium]|nr:hypothetical protein [Thermomicrobiales bacterium]
MTMQDARQALARVQRDIAMADLQLQATTSSPAGQPHLGRVIVHLYEALLALAAEVERLEQQHPARRP